ncbi:unnamed protein product [Oikopleura dioica]|uniref:Glycine zipper domain-containing protein n=1 Tax=Oikopleura dioica TaxID=34765 RepID=E4YUR6_OIKDI|nr:unnamed protein product [Oikopleura dioica]
MISQYEKKSIGAISGGTIGGATGAILGTILLPGAGTMLLGGVGAAVGGHGGFKLGKLTGKLGRKIGSKDVQKSKNMKKRPSITEKNLFIGDIGVRLNRRDFVGHEKERQTVFDH